MILHNPETGAIAHADSATVEHFKYDRFDILVPYKDTDRSFFMGSVEQNVIEGLNHSRNDKSLWVGRITSDNIIEGYKDFISSVSCIKDTTVLGYNTWNGIPIPLTYGNVYPPRDYNYKHRSVKFLVNGDSTCTHSLVSFANLLNVENKIKAIPDSSRWIYKPFLDNKYKWVLSSGYFTNSVETNSLLLGVLFNIYDISDSEIQKYYQTALGMFEHHIDRDNCLKLLNSRPVKESFFGRSKGVMEFLDEFGFTPVKNKQLDAQLKKLTLKFDKSLSTVRKLLRGCGASGEWVLYEERGVTYLKGSNGNVSLGGGLSTIVNGCCRKYPENIWYKAISGTIDRLIKEIKKPLKEVKFGVEDKSSSIDISKSKQEATSYVVELRK